MLTVLKLRPHLLCCIELVVTSWLVHVSYWMCSTMQLVICTLLLVCIDS